MSQCLSTSIASPHSLFEHVDKSFSFSIKWWVVWRTTGMSNSIGLPVINWDLLWDTTFSGNPWATRGDENFHVAYCGLTYSNTFPYLEDWLHLDYYREGPVKEWPSKVNVELFPRLSWLFSRIYWGTGRCLLHSQASVSKPLNHLEQVISYKMLPCVPVVKFHQDCLLQGLRNDNS